LVGKIRNLHFLTADVALMHVIEGTVMEGQTGIDPERNSVQTIVATKNNKGEWRLAAFQNTRAQYLERPKEAHVLTEELRRLL
jgi:uncharacterized protein (TIGR02246 family)